jgi:cytoskeleton protein RodZ
VFCVCCIIKKSFNSEKLGYQGNDETDVIDSIGEKLCQRRMETGLSLEQVAQGTHLRLHYLEAIEAGNFDRLPSMVQARGFLRVYASFLDLDPEELVESLDVEVNTLSDEQKEISPPEVEDRQIALGEEWAIFKEIGNKLQHQRELLGLNLEEVERQTHLRFHYLKALESGNLDDLPSPVQGRGMLSNYAEFLGLNPDPILLRFADGLQVRLATKQATEPRQTDKKPSRGLSSSLRRVFSSDFILVGILVLVLGVFVVWGLIRVNSINNGTQATATVPSIADALLPTENIAILATSEAIASPTVNAASETKSVGAPPATAEVGLDNPEVVESAVTEELPPTPIGSGPVQVSLIVRQRSWLRVTVDGKVELEGRVIPGSAYSFAGEDEVEILTGNGAALQLIFNQNDLGPMGIFGEVVDRVFTPQGELLPTPTITATATPTATQENTQTQTETPQVTTAP